MRQLRIFASKKHSRARANLAILPILLTLQACEYEPSKKELVLQCMNPRIQEGSFASGVEEYQGIGRVTVTVMMLGESAVVDFNGQVFSGELTLDEDVFVKDPAPRDGKYPMRETKLKISRHAGDGFFQRLTYTDGDTLPDFRTHHIQNCVESKPRF